MKKLVILLGLLMLHWSTIAQQQNPIWALPSLAAGSGYFDFNSDTYKPFPTSDPVTGLPYPETCGVDGGFSPLYLASIPEKIGTHNAYHDVDGNLLFFIVGDNIFDRDGRTIWADVADFGANQISSGYSEICVVPHPGNCNQYYLFTSKTFFQVNHPIFPPPTPFPTFEELLSEAFFGILDVSIQNDLALGTFNACAKGRLIQPFESLVLFAGLSTATGISNPHTSFAASPADASDGSRVVLSYTNADVHGTINSFQQLLKFKLDNSGLTFIGADQIFDPLNTLTGGNRLDSDRRTELEMLTLSNGNFRVATANEQQLVVFDIDGTTLDIIGGSEKVKPIVISDATFRIEYLD